MCAEARKQPGCARAPPGRELEQDNGWLRGGTEAVRPDTRRRREGAAGRGGAGGDGGGSSSGGRQTASGLAWPGGGCGRAGGAQCVPVRLAEAAGDGAAARGLR